MTSFFDQHALYWLGGFILIYALAHLLITRHSRFAPLSEAHQKITIKLLTIGIFTAVYLFVKLLGR